MSKKVELTVTEIEMMLGSFANHVMSEDFGILFSKEARMKITITAMKAAPVLCELALNDRKEVKNEN